MNLLKPIVREQLNRACVLLLVAGVVVNMLFGHYAFHPRDRFAHGATIVFLSYVIAVPIVLYFLKGDRFWRWAVIGIWFVYIAIFGYVMLTMD